MLLRQPSSRTAAWVALPTACTRVARCCHGHRVGAPLHLHSHGSGGMLARSSRGEQQRSVNSLEPDPLPPAAESSQPAAPGGGPRRPRWRAWLRRLPALPGQLDVRTLLIQARALLLAALAAAVLLAVRCTAAARAASAPREVLYSDFVTLLDSGRVRAARIESASSRLFFECHATEAKDVAPAVPAVGKRGAAPVSAAASTAPAAAARTAVPADQQQQQQLSGVTPAAAKPPLRRRFFVKLADRQDPLVLSRMLAAGVEFGVVRPSFGSQLQNSLLTVLALWLPLLPLLFLAQRLMDARGGSRRTRTPAADAPRVTFADVAGVSSAKEELREVVACLRNAEAYARLGARAPSGVLLSGPPGTGKTLLAKAVAGEAGVPFIAVSASEFVELFVGRGAARVRELFAEARKAAPCVVFIDELDALGAARGRGFNDERDQTLNQLLTELDGFAGRQGVMLLAATNRPDVLDPALLRPGRISRRVLVPLPDEGGRTAILGVHLRGVTLGDGGPGDEAGRTALARSLAAVTPGFSGAELANVVNEALLLVARRGGDTVTLTDLLDGVRRTRYGVNGGGGGAETDLGQRLGRWLLSAAAPRSERAVKVAAS